MAIVLITGGSGLIGRQLTQALLSEGHEVRWLSRQAGTHGRVRAFAWDVTAGRIDTEALSGVERVVHLAGAGIADRRWTKARVQELIASRADPARLLLKAVMEAQAPVECLVSASGIGYYGATTSERIWTEADPPGKDTIGRISEAWERAVDDWASRCRVVKLRTPIVLAREGGALPQLARPFRMGLGAVLGSGAQWMPWVHIGDLVAAYQLALDHNGLSGAYNVVADQVANRAFSQAVATALKRRMVLPAVPAWTLRLALGELAGVLLEGSRADGSRLRDAGFIYRFEELSEALADLLGPDFRRAAP